MERLTERQAGSVGYIGRHARRVPGMAEPAETMRVAATRDVLQRLADYEDTGLEPHQIKAKTRRRGISAAPAFCPYCDPEKRTGEEHLYVVKTRDGRWVPMDQEIMKHCLYCGRKIKED